MLIKRQSKQRENNAPQHLTEHDWDDPQPCGPMPHPTVYEAEPIDTGLLDASGNRIFRHPEKIGFF